MMTVTEIREHASRLQDLMNIKRGQLARGEYTGNLGDNLHLVEALEGRIRELQAHCDAAEATFPLTEPAAA